jgi:Holliday junction DNA helicase RuvB
MVERAVKRVVSGEHLEEDAALDTSLRPRRLAEYIGQERVKGLLEIEIAAAKQRDEPLDHVLLYGPPGLGKTTLAHIIASEMGVSVKTTSGPAIERAGDMVAILTQLKRYDVLFIDEIHRLPRVVEEVLYSAMEDFAVSWVMEKGLKARNVNLTIQPFTLVGATTRFGALSGPLRDRFGSVHRLDFYDENAMDAIVRRSARILNIKVETDGAREIARRARGTPRIANRLLKRVRDYAQVKADGVTTVKVAKEALSGLQVDDLGLDEIDRQVMRAIIEKFGGGPVGLETVAASISEEAETIEDVYEPFLMQLGFLDRTPRGRAATPRAYQHLGIAPPKGKDAGKPNQRSMF